MMTGIRQRRFGEKPTGGCAGCEKGSGHAHTVICNKRFDVVNRTGSDPYGAQASQPSSSSSQPAAAAAAAGQPAAAQPAAAKPAAAKLAAAAAAGPLQQKLSSVHFDGKEFDLGDDKKTRTTVDDGLTTATGDGTMTDDVTKSSSSSASSSSSSSSMAAPSSLKRDVNDGAVPNQADVSPKKSRMKVVYEEKCARLVCKKSDRLEEFMDLSEKARTKEYKLDVPDVVVPSLSKRQVSEGKLREFESLKEFDAFDEVYNKDDIPYGATIMGPR